MTEDFELSRFWFKHHLCDCIELPSSLMLLYKVLKLFDKEVKWEIRQTKLDELLPGKDLQGLFLSFLETEGLLEHGGNIWSSWLDGDAPEFIEYMKDKSLLDLEEYESKLRAKVLEKYS